MSTLQIIWFVLVVVLLVGYTVLDGFDLGSGFWHLFTKKDEERRTVFNAIGPFWDGNEVWLITGGGALFAAFPPVYATVFSGFYLALMLVLFGLIFRAVSIEFRSQEESPLWRKSWDVAFAVGSILPALLYGVAMGNLIRGIPLSEGGDYIGSFFALLNPYSLLIGLVGLAMFIHQGATYLMMKTEGELEQRTFGWSKISVGVYCVLFLVGTIVTAITQPQVLTNYQSVPILYLLPVLSAALILLSGMYAWKKNGLLAFLTSSGSIVTIWLTVAAGMFPNFVPASNNPDFSLTLANSSSSEYTLSWMLAIALVGMPLVLGYTFWVYYTFRGKVSGDEGYGH